MSILKFSINDFLLSLSTALDFLEMDLFRHVTYHNKRVAYICDRIGEALDFSDDDRFDLTTCALLHDSGVAAYQFDVKTRASAEGPKGHCRHSQDILDQFPLLSSRETVLLYHHEYADGSGYFGLTEQHIPLFSAIIGFADQLDLMYTKSKEEIKQYVISNRGLKFPGWIVDIWLPIAATASYWLDMDHNFISIVLPQRLPKRYLELSWEDIHSISQIFSSIIDKKSTFTARHSRGLSEKAEHMASFYGFDADRKTKFVIAADLHDLGKLAIPNAILDKPDKLTPEEFEIIKTHTYYTRFALDSINYFEDITRWASHHHEKLTGSGYPFGIKTLGLEERLMTVLDIYQALTEERPYRSGLTHSQTMDILYKMTAQNEIDLKLVQDVDATLGAVGLQ